MKKDLTMLVIGMSLPDFAKGILTNIPQNVTLIEQNDIPTQLKITEEEIIKLGTTPFPLDAVRSNDEVFLPEKNYIDGKTLPRRKRK